MNINKLISSIIVSIISINIGLLSSVNIAMADNSKKIKSSCKKKQIIIPIDYNSFETEIIKWIGQCVKSRSKENGKPARREIKLVKNNTTILDTWKIVKNMQGIKVGIVAKYIGKNKVTRIMFSPRNYDSKPILFQEDRVFGKTMLHKRWKLKKKRYQKRSGNSCKACKSFCEACKKNS